MMWKALGIVGIPAARGSSPYTPYLTYTSSFQIRYFCSHFWRRKLKPRDVSVLKVTYHVGGTRFEPRSSSSCLMAQTVKHLLTMWETWGRSLGREDPLRRKWQPTPVLLPGKSHGWRSLVGYSPWVAKSRLSGFTFTLTSSSKPVHSPPVSTGCIRKPLSSPVLPALSAPVTDHHDMLRSHRSSPAQLSCRAELLRKPTTPHTREPLNSLLSLGRGGVKPTRWHLPKVFFNQEAIDSPFPHCIRFLFIQPPGSAALCCCWGLVAKLLSTAVQESEEWIRVGLPRQPHPFPPQTPKTLLKQQQQSPELLCWVVPLHPCSYPPGKHQYVLLNVA